MGTGTLHIDIAIIGGGIAGLWALNSLRNNGYSAVLFESEALGGYQTIGSQGIIHGGIKYALSGVLDRASDTIAAMPQVWRDCLAGRGAVDLRGCEILSEGFHLWSDTALPSRLSAFFASKLLRGRVDKLTEDQYPAALRWSNLSGQVYRLPDFVLDIPSLVEALARPHRDALLRIDWSAARLQRQGREATLALPGCNVVPQRLLLCAGAGNEALMATLGSSSPAMQRRPLQQVVVKHQYPQPLYAHCMGGNPSPRLTVTSHRNRAGEPIWYLGGDLATAGADVAPQRVIDSARRELDELLPDVNLGETQWRTVRLDRAEPRQSTALRPDNAFLGKLDSVDNTLVAWPTKLTLCPQLGDELISQLNDAGIRPGLQPDLSLLAPLGQPPLARPYWDTLFQ